MSRQRLVLSAPKAQRALSMPALMHGTIRGGLGVGVGNPVVQRVGALFEAPPEVMAEVTAAVRSDLKGALWGLAHWFTREELIALCGEVVDEDLDPALGHTPHGDEAAEIADRAAYGGAA